MRHANNSAIAEAPGSVQPMRALVAPARRDATLALSQMQIPLLGSGARAQDPARPARGETCLDWRSR